MGIKIIHDNSSRFLCLLFLFVLFNCSNKSDKNLEKYVLNKPKVTYKNSSSDSLQIVVKNIPAETTVSFIYNDVDLKSKYIELENKTKVPATVSKKISKAINFDYTLLYRTFTMFDNKLQTNYHNYFLDQSVHRAEFLFDEKNGNVVLKDHDGDVIQYDNIVKAYQEISRTTLKITPKERVLKFENLHAKYQAEVSDSNIHRLNDLVFYKHISLLYPNNEGLEDYLMNLKNPIWSTDLMVTVYQYLQARRENLYALDLNRINNDVYKKLIEIGVGNHLVEYKDKEYPAYTKNLNWFKKTGYFADNRESFEKILIADEKVSSIKSDLLSFDLYENGKVVKLESVLSSTKSRYFLLDFWATWCIPCLQNIETMHTMKLPENLKIIYVSMDRTKDKEKWSLKAQKFNLENSYLFAETLNNKAIIKKINLNQLPRYVLIDSGFNVLNADMATPQEADFLKELNTYMK
ncbi:TlpA family protein disulfide reductase [Sphingobacterium zeae]|uniref:TlpA family protein disulfide reductase n=1 Tax=Sphingobacterium zeae TaxID=1776859 RepID=UPI003622EE42